MNGSPRAPSDVSRSLLANIGLPLGPLLALALFWGLGWTALAVEARVTAAVVGWMAAWWLSEAIPLPATALLPLILFPILPVYTAESLADASAFELAAAPFANRFIFLFLGGFLIARSIERWNLHRRMALATLRVFGTAPRRVVAGFMCATAALSMWISNTATTVMMLPIAVSVIARLARAEKEGAGEASDDEAAAVSPVAAEAGSNLNVHQTKFATCLMLAVAYAASIGGIATLVGTPPNALLAGFLRTQGRSLDFANWMALALPLSMLLLVATWFLLTFLIYRFRLPPVPRGRELIRGELRGLGRMSAGEWVTLVVFLSTALMWIVRKPLAEWPWLVETCPPIGRLDDSIIALIGGVSLFAIPVAWRPIRMALDWPTARKLPWGILLLFGGGLSLADAVQSSGLGAAIGDAIAAQQGLSLAGLIILITVVVVFLTEFTSNLATTALLLPVLFQIAAGMTFADGSPVPAGLLLVPAALAASCAFMMPVATPPNAIVFASDMVTIPQMAKTGFWINLLCIAVVPIWVLLWGPLLIW